MWPKGFGPQGTGPAITTLRAAATRTASIIRCIGVACAVLQVIIWHSYYLAVPWRLAGPVAAMVWGSAVVAYLLRRWPVWQLAALDSGFYLVLALCARWFVPPVLSGNSSNWLYIGIVAQLVAPAWFTPTTVLAVLALASVTAYWAGAVMTPADWTGSASPVTAGVLLLAVASAAWFGRRMLYRRAVAADDALAGADRDSREQYVLLSRHAERREHERLLHDTVLNTLTVLARGGGPSGNVVCRCGDDVALIERALCDPEEGDGGGLLTGIEAVAGQMRSRGLDVHVAVTGGEAGSMPAMPAQVARAMAHAVREALTNVVSHAGTGEAWVEVGPADGGGVCVTVRDAGAGFDPARVDPGRLGLRRSIAERIADHGGHASVWSAPGQGTVVSLQW
jgi:signal transduction histidine kinase